MIQGDVGGLRTRHSCWKNYVERSAALIWVVMQQAFTLSKTAGQSLQACYLTKLVVSWSQEIRARGATLLIIANKTHEVCSMTDEDIIQICQIYQIL